MGCSEPVQRGWWVDSLKSWRTPSPSDAFTVSFIRTVCATVPLRDEFTGCRSCSLSSRFLRACFSLQYCVEEEMSPFVFRISHDCGPVYLTFNEFYTNIYESGQEHHATGGHTTAAPLNSLQQSHQHGSPRSLGYTTILISWQQVTKNSC